MTERRYRPNPDYVRKIQLTEGMTCLTTEELRQFAEDSAQSMLSCSAEEAWRIIDEHRAASSCGCCCHIDDCDICGTIVAVEMRSIRWLIEGPGDTTGSDDSTET